jgi:DNA-binding MarR family transcriptional regulator
MQVQKPTVPARQDRTALGLALMLEQSMRLVYPERSPQDMHPGQWAALRFLARANKEARTVLGLARYLGVTQGPASRAVAALMRKELVAGDRDTKDRRVLRLELTDAGRKLLEADPILRLAALIGELPGTTQQEMATAISGLFQGLTAQASEEASDPFRLDGKDTA